jgi:hypothetical protein
MAKIIRLGMAGVRARVGTTGTGRRILMGIAAEIGTLLRETDAVAEVHNTLRAGSAVELEL